VTVAAIVLGGPPQHGLDEHLGADRRARLEAALIAHATAWAEAVAPGRSSLVLDPPHATAPDIAARLPAGVPLEPATGADPGERIAAATAAAFERHGGPVLVATAGVPRLGRHHAAAALADLDAGAAASFGPNMDGGWYLAALARPEPELFALAAEVWEGPVVLARMLGVAQELGMEVGLLRMERRIASVADVRAFVLDPLTPRTVIDALS
jgi:glycosyltransferase A (GT-A) superfamily protein (DUF2064 family)